MITIWIFASKAFLSVVQNEKDPELLLVRARMPRHIEALFPDATIQKTPDSDYLYRANVSRQKVAEVVKQQIMNLDYPNFKNSILDLEYHDACFDVWQTMYDMQSQHERYENEETRKEQYNSIMKVSPTE